MTSMAASSTPTFGRIRDCVVIIRGNGLPSESLDGDEERIIRQCVDKWGDLSEAYDLAEFDCEARIYMRSDEGLFNAKVVLEARIVVVITEPSFGDLRRVFQFVGGYTYARLHLHFCVHGFPDGSLGLNERERPTAGQIYEAVVKYTTELSQLHFYLHSCYADAACHSIGLAGHRLRHEEGDLDKFTPSAFGMMHDEYAQYTDDITLACKSSDPRVAFLGHIADVALQRAEDPGAALANVADIPLDGGVGQAGNWSVHKPEGLLLNTDYAASRDALTIEGGYDDPVAGGASDASNGAPADDVELHDQMLEIIFGSLSHLRGNLRGCPVAFGANGDPTNYSAVLYPAGIGPVPDLFPDPKDKEVRRQLEDLTSRSLPVADPIVAADLAFDRPTLFLVNARCGDAAILALPVNNEDGDFQSLNLVIDGGYKSTFEKWKGILVALGYAHVICTHADQDHVEGLEKLATEAMADPQWDDLIGTVMVTMGGVALAGLDEPEQLQTRSYRQLQALIAAFESKTVFVGRGSVIEAGNTEGRHVRVFFLNPSSGTMERAQKKRDPASSSAKRPKKESRSGVDAENHASAAFLVLWYEGDSVRSSMLFTGDAPADLIIAGLVARAETEECVKDLLQDPTAEPSKDNVFLVDYADVPHHGSVRNERECLKGNARSFLFDRVRANEYGLSYNGTAHKTTMGYGVTLRNMIRVHNAVREPAVVYLTFTEFENWPGVCSCPDTINSVAVVAEEICDLDDASSKVSSSAGTLLGLAQSTGDYVDRMMGKEISEGANELKAALAGTIDAINGVNGVSNELDALRDQAITLRERMNGCTVCTWSTSDDGRGRLRFGPYVSVSVGAANGHIIYPM